MIKTYKLNMRMNSARIILEGHNGNKVIYEFTGGNVINNTPAKMTLGSEYDQKLIESSDAFKNHSILLIKVEKTAEDEKKEREAEERAKQEGFKQVDDVKSVTEAIAYCVEHFNQKATSARNALEIAEQNGVTFPNLKLGKK